MIFVKSLLWDKWNVAHIRRHDVVPEEVEEVCHNKPIVWETYGNRLLLVGPTNSSRMLAVVLAPIGEGIYHTITARVASRKERQRYKEEGDIDG